MDDATPHARGSSEYCSPLKIQCLLETPPVVVYLFMLEMYILVGRGNAAASEVVEGCCTR